MATLTKWYPVLLVLPILVFMFYRRTRKILLLRFVITYGVVCICLVLPTYLSGGVNALLVPYLFHAGRVTEPNSLPGLIDPMLRALPLYNNSDVVLKTIFLLLQVCVGGFAVFVRLDTFQKLLTWSLLTIATYILFARIYSPQWALWILPFLVLLACDRFDMALICVYGVVTYLEFPIVYDFMGEASRSMRVMGLLNALLLILIIIRAGVRFVRLHNTETLVASTIQA